MELNKCDRCKKPTLSSKLNKYSYNRFHWMFCEECYINATTKVSSYFARK